MSTPPQHPENPSAELADYLDEVDAYVTALWTPEYREAKLRQILADVHATDAPPTADNHPAQPDT